MTDLNHYIKLIESAEQLDELNWKKSLATAATAGALALGANGAQAQSYDSSPLHRDLSNISNKLDRDISATQQANKAANQAKSFAGAQIIIGGLKALGDALQNEKYKTQAEAIMNTPGHPLFQKQTKGWRIRRSDMPLLPPYEDRRNTGHPNIACKGRSWKLVDGKRVWYDK